MIAFLIDPEARTIEEIDFDGDESSIPRLLGCEDVTFEQWPAGRSLAMRICTDVNAVDNRAMYGFWVPNTGGIINHGRCLQVTYDTRDGKFVSSQDDLDYLKRHYRVYVPGKGVHGVYDEGYGVRGKRQWK